MNTKITWKDIVGSIIILVLFKFFGALIALVIAVIGIFIREWWEIRTFRKKEKKKAKLIKIK
jgi:hypothetical protein